MAHPVKIWSFYDPATGAFIGRTFSGNESILAANIPEGHKAIEGHHDHMSRRVDVETGEVVDWQPEQPSAEHEWDQDSRRWTLSAEAQERERRRAEALKRIAALEAAQQRPLRELALGISGAKERVIEIEHRIVAIRESLRSSPISRS